MCGVALGDGRSGGGVNPPPAVGATLIATALIVLVIGFGWLNSRGSAPEERLAPMVDGVTLPLDDEGDPVDIPPSQPATPVLFGPGGEILRPDPVRARVVDESGEEVLVPLSPNTTVDTVTGEIVPTTTATTGRPGSTATTRPGSTVTTAPPSSPTTAPPSSPTTSPPTTAPPTTAPPTTAPPTTEPPTTEPPPTTAPPTTDPPEDPGLLDGLADAVLP